MERFFKWGEERGLTAGGWRGRNRIGVGRLGGRSLLGRGITSGT